MFKNTANLSFLLYGFFIFAGLFSIFIVYRLIKNKTFEIEQIDKFLDYFKWVIITLAVSSVTLIISDLFRERDQDMKEIEYFDKYVSQVKNQDSIEIRYQLVRYLATVAPDGYMKKSWENYFDSINKDYNKLKEAKKIVEKNSDIRNPTPQQTQLIQDSKEEIKLIKTPLTSDTKSEMHSSPSLAYIKSNNKNPQLAAENEDKAFNYLVNKDLENAIKFFIQSENAYNAYHQVYEIAKFLKENRNSINSNPDNWNVIFKTILEKYSWKMPEKYKNALNNKID